jgi:hypothetical protein
VVLVTCVGYFALCSLITMTESRGPQSSASSRWGFENVTVEAAPISEFLKKTSGKLNWKKFEGPIVRFC